MDYSDKELYDIVNELDQMASDVDDKSADFIEDVLERGQRRFSPKQRQWIMDLKERYLD